MNIKESQSEQYGTFVSGISYTGLLAFVLLLLCYIIDKSLFDFTFTYLIITIICCMFFITGIKKIDKNRMGYLSKLGGAPDFNHPYSQGTYWIFPFWKFEQTTSNDIIQSSDPISLTERTSDGIPIIIEVFYTWKIINAESAFKNFNLGVIEKTIESEINKIIQNSTAVEIIASPEITEKNIIERVKDVSNKIGISLETVIPKINIHENYQSRKEEIRQKYLELKYKLDEKYSELDFRKNEQGLKKNDMETEKLFLKQYIDEMKFTPSEALNYLKVYKNEVNMNETTYNIGELNKVIEAVMSFFKR